MSADRSLCKAASKQEASTTSTVIHVRGFARDRGLCGAKRDPQRPTKWGFPDCVVCVEMVKSDPALGSAIRAYWAARNG